MASPHFFHCYERLTYCNLAEKAYSDILNPMKALYLIAAASLFAAPLMAQAPATAEAPAPAAAPALADYTAPMEKLFTCVEKINAALREVKDIDSADDAGDVLRTQAPILVEATSTFSVLPAPPADIQAEFDSWFAERQQTLMDLVTIISDLESAEPPFYGSEELITGVTIIGLILSGQQPE